MGLSDLLFPRKCKLCSAGCEDGSICLRCRQKLYSAIDKRKRTLYVDGCRIEAHYIFDHDNPYVNSLLYAIKRNGNNDLFRFASHLYIKAMPEEFMGYTCTFVPRKVLNVRKYGYDHMERILKCLCRDSGINLKSQRLIKRKGVSLEQKELNLQERFENVKGKFRVTKKNIPKDILLFDDVVTTGASAMECARKLIEQGCENITCVFLASAEAHTAFPQ